MKNYSMMLTTIICILFNSIALAGDDPSIKEPVRSKVQKAMNDFIKQNTMNGGLLIHDGKLGEVYRLTFHKLHNGIVKKSGYYVSCADFKNQTGEKVDVDFLVAAHDGEYKMLEAIVHKVNKHKRPYVIK